MEDTLFGLEQAGKSQSNIPRTFHSLCCRTNQLGSLLEGYKDLLVSARKEALQTFWLIITDKAIRAGTEKAIQCKSI